MDPARITAALGPLLERELGGAVTLSGVRSMTGGAAREAWALDATVSRAGRADERLALVLLLFRPGGQRAFSAHDELRLLQATSAAGAPVPRPVLAGEVEGRSFYVMERLEGETIGRRLVRDERWTKARAALPAQLARALAAIHRVPVGAGELGFLPRPAPGVPVATSEIDRLEELYRQVTVEPHPAFEIALRWLRAHQPPPGDVTLVHGDFRIGNVMVGEEGLRAVLDWELAHVGDPLEDVGWLCVRSWRFGADHLPLGGIGTREELFRAYAEASGREVDPEVVRFWEVYGNLRWGVFTLLQARAFLDGVVPSVELASIGRRTAETEWELLNLIEGRAF
ncbi:MAG: phosphotransferase family protein [Thermodesulfobacteriota bacterium]